MCICYLDNYSYTEFNDKTIDGTLNWQHIFVPHHLNKSPDACLLFHH